MSPVDDLRTSATLLAKLVDPANHEAWQRFMNLYQPFIYSHCLRFLHDRDAAGDMTATVLLKIARGMKTFRYDRERSFRGWLRTIIARCVQDKWRRQRREPEVAALGGPDSERRLLELVDPATEGRDALIDAITDEVNPRLERQLALAQQAMELVRGRVKPHRWKAFWQTAVEDRKAADVARELGLTINSVFVAKHQIGKMLRAQFAALEAQSLRTEGETR